MVSSRRARSGQALAAQPSRTLTIVLTFIGQSLRLIAVQRVLALLLIPALVATSGVVSSLHTHAYGAHDHPEHHHGLAAHEHDAMPAHPDEGTPRLEGCDPGKHVIPFAFVCAAPSQVHAVDAVIISLPARFTPQLQIQCAVRHADVRVHGPPVHAQASPRAPPLIAHA
jgi:hypothetical protein